MIFDAPGSPRNARDVMAHHDPDADHVDFFPTAPWGARAGGESLAECADCGEPIPEARRLAVPGVTLCIACQTEADRLFRPAGGINRRGSKDSQLK